LRLRGFARDADFAFAAIALKALDGLLLAEDLFDAALLPAAIADF